MKRTKNIFLIVLSVLAGLGLLFWLIGFAGIKDTIKIFRHLPIDMLIYFFIVSSAIDIFLALRWKLIVSQLGYKISFINMYVYRLMGYAVSYITPSAHVGGEPVRAMMLKRHNVKTTEAISSVLLDKSVELTADLFFGTLGMFMLLISFNVPKLSYLFMFIALFLTIYLVTRFFMRLTRNERTFVKLMKKLKFDRFRITKSIIQKMDEIEKSMCSFMSKSLKGFYTAVSISIILWGFMYLEYYFALKLVGITPTLMQIFLVGVLIALSYMIPVPAALGVLEAGQVSAFALLGLKPDSAIAFSLIIRGRDLLRTVFGLIFLSHSGIKRIFRER